MDEQCSTEEDKSEYTKRHKKTQGMRLHMMRLILTSLPYLNAEEKILMCHMKKRTWPLQAMNTLQTCLTIKTNIMILATKDCPVKSSKKLFSKSWKRKKKKLNVKSKNYIRYLISVSRRYEFTKEGCNIFIRETTCFRRSGKSVEISRDALSIQTNRMTR